MAKPGVLILDLSDSVGIATQVLHCLAAAGTFDIQVASRSRNSSHRFSRWVKKLHFIENSSNSKALLEQLKAILRKGGIDVLLPVNIGDADLLVFHGDDELKSLVHITDQASPWARLTAGNKSFFSCFMEDLNLPYPRTVVFDAEDDAIQPCLEAIQAPIIVKPSWGGGGANMRLFKSHDGLLPYLQENSTQQNPLIVQEYFPGHDLGSAVFCIEGEILYFTMQRNLSPDQTSFTPSRGLQFFDDPVISEKISRLMGDLRWSGVAQIDLRVEETTGKLYILEINPRYWGSVLGSQHMGVNFPEIACRRALGLPDPKVTYRLGKYITAAGYLRYLGDKLRGIEWLENFSYSESAFDEIIKDPLPWIIDRFQGIILKIRNLKSGGRS